MPVFRRLIPSTFPFFLRYHHCITNVTTKVFSLTLSVYQTSLIHPRSIPEGLRVYGSQLQIIWAQAFRYIYSCNTDLTPKSESALPTIVVPEGQVLVDIRIAIRILNLHSFQRVTVRVHAAQTNGTAICFESYGHFIADISGNVDIAKDASFGGTYKGVDGMGLFWSMLPVPGQRKGIRWVTRDVTKPMHFFVAVFDGHVMSNEKAANPSEAVAALPLPLANATILRTYLSDDVERREINVRNIRGTLFLPKESRRFPGLL